MNPHTKAFTGNHLELCIIQFIGFHKTLFSEQCLMSREDLGVCSTIPWAEIQKGIEKRQQAEHQLPWLFADRRVNESSDVMFLLLHLQLLLPTRLPHRDGRYPQRMSRNEPTLP